MVIQVFKWKVTLNVPFIFSWKAKTQFEVCRTRLFLADIQVSRLIYSLQISRYPGLYIPCRYPGIQVYILLVDIQVSRFIYSLQISRYPGLYIPFRYPGIQVYILGYIQVYIFISSLLKDNIVIYLKRNIPCKDL